MRFARPVAGASIAAGVAAMSIFWLRTQEDPQSAARRDANAAATESIVLDARRPRRHRGAQYRPPRARTLEW